MAWTYLFCPSCRVCPLSWPYPKKSRAFDFETIKRRRVTGGNWKPLSDRAGFLVVGRGTNRPQ
jgi:hypothetical protein